MNRKVPSVITTDQLAAIGDAFNRQLEPWPTQAVEFRDWHALAHLVTQLLAVKPGTYPIVGLSGSQGSGKSTFGRILAEHCTALTVASLDDFYLTRRERQQLAADVHPLLATRGVPGTHDHAWLADVLKAVSAGEAFALPRFDKGADDRDGQTTTRCDGLLLEGWCVGVMPQTAEQLRKPCNTLETEEDETGAWRRWVNQQLAEHYVPLWSQIDFWIHLRVPSFAEVVAWRTQQEQQIPAAQRMSEAQVRRFIEHYQRLTEHLWATPPQGPGLVVELGRDHSITGVQAID